jgi:hypothetical protein
MSYNTGARIVRDGLVMYLDAANSKSIVSGSNSWVNLTRSGNNGTLTNGPLYTGSFGGSIVFDGSNDYISETTVLSDAFWQTNWSVSAWVNFDTINNTINGGGDRPIVQHGQIGTRQGLHLTQRNSRFYFGLYSDDTEGIRIISAGQWYNVVYTLNNTSRLRQLFINGNFDNSGTGAGAYTGIGTNTRICGAFLFGSYFDGFMASFSAYNRVLSSDEILQNYNATKKRFGL